MIKLFAEVIFMESFFTNAFHFSENKEEMYKAIIMNTASEEAEKMRVEYYSTQFQSVGKNLSIGVGVTFDSVIVTKIGISGSYDVKAFGNCINVASHYASETENKVKVSKKVKNEWPTSKGGGIRFVSVGDSEAYYLQST